MGCVTRNLYRSSYRERWGLKIARGTATHFLTYEDPQTGGRDLLDCVPLEEYRDGTVKVAVFSEEDDSSTICEVDAARVLSVEEVTSEIVSDVLNDIVLTVPRDDRPALTLGQSTRPEGSSQTAAR